MLLINSPYPQFYDLDGTPLDGGALYFGEPNENPETSPVTVYWDAAGTQPAAQPVATSRGYPARYGTPGSLYCAADASMTVKNRRGQLVISVQSMQDVSAADMASQQVSQQVRADLASASADKGAGMIGYSDATVYTGGVGLALRDRLSKTLGGVVTGDTKMKAPLRYTASIAAFYGDSITSGVGSTGNVNGWAQRMQARMGWPSINNGAISGGSIMDWIVGLYGTAIADDQIGFILPGFNDQRFIGTNLAQQEAYRYALYAAVAHLAIPDSQKIKGNSASVVYTGTWGNSPVRSYGKYTDVIGSTATFIVNGSTIYISTLQQLGSGGNLQVSIDGVDMGSFYLQTQVANGGAVSSITYMPLLLRFPDLAEGKHTVVITKTDASAANRVVWVDWVAGSSQKAGCRARVVVGSTLRMNAAGAALSAPYNKYTEAVNQQFTRIAEQVCADLSSDGLEVLYVRANGVYDPDDATQVNGDNVHPSDNGHEKIYLGFLSGIYSEGMLSSWTASIAGMRRLRQGLHGTWLPTLTGLTTPGAVTYTVQEAEYQINGKVCTASFRIAVSAVAGGPTGAVLVSLPFANAGSYLSTGCVGRHSGITLSANAYGLYIEAPPGKSYALLRQAYTPGELELPWVNIAAGAEIRGTISYIVQ